MLANPLSARFLLITLSIIMLTSHSGCGSRKPSVTVPVAGQARIGEHVLGGAELIAWPEHGDDKNRVSILVNAEGNFQTALPPGRYKVTFSLGRAQANPKSFNPKKEGSDTVFDRDGEPRKLQSKYRDPKETDLIIDIPEGGTQDLIIHFK